MNRFLPGHDEILMGAILNVRRTVPFEIAITFNEVGANRPIYPAFMAAAGEADGFDEDTAIAKQLTLHESIKGSGTTLQDKGVHVQLSYNFWDCCRRSWVTPAIGAAGEPTKTWPLRKHRTTLR